MHFTAKLNDGSTMSDLDVTSVAKLPLKSVSEVEIHHKGLPPVSIQADTTQGEEVFFFVRNSMAVGSGDAAKTSVPVFEIRKLGTSMSRLYWHPERGPILSSRDLYF